MFKYIFLIIIILFCSAFIVVGASFIHKINNLIKKCTLKITGEIIDYSREQKYDNDTSRFYYVYTPIVKCYIAGIEIVKKLNTGHRSRNIEVQETGKEIEVFFNPDNYDEFYTIEDKGLKTVGIVMICIGSFAILFISIFFVIPLLFNDILLKMLLK